VPISLVNQGNAHAQTGVIGKDRRGWNWKDAPVLTFALSHWFTTSLVGPAKH